MLKNKITLALIPILSTFTLQAADPFFDDPFGNDMFEEMKEMQREMDKVFERMQKRMDERRERLNHPNTQFNMPVMGSRTSEMFVDRGSYYEYDTGVEANKENEINLSVRDGILTFKAKVTKSSASTQQGMQSQQRYTSMMQRSQTLPHDADENTVKMEEKKGVIVVTIQKKKVPLKPLHPATPKKEKKPVDPEKPSLMKDRNSTYEKVPQGMTEA